MSNRNDLLSIGEMAKLTGAKIRALHYYERKNILKPAYIDPDSGYRYYSYNQVVFVALIIHCVEFGIPLKELAGVIEADDLDALGDFIQRSLEIIEKKSMLLKLARDCFEQALQKIAIGKEYNTGQIYRREFKEKVYYVKPYGPTIPANNINLHYEVSHEIYGDDVKHLADIDDWDGLIPMPDAGRLCQYSHDSASYYGFREIPKRLAGNNTITIPGGTYYFRKDETSRIKDARTIFQEQLAGIDSFMVVEVEELFLSKTKVSQTMYELRLVAL